MHNSDLVNLSNARLFHARDCIKEATILLAAENIKAQHTELIMPHSTL